MSKSSLYFVQATRYVKIHHHDHLQLGAHQVSKVILRDYEEHGFLPHQNMVAWRVILGEEIPKPEEGEVVIFLDLLQRGFSPPGSKFFRDVLHLFHLHPQDLGPNSISNLCQFQVFC